MIAYRILIYKKGCPHCREALKVIDWINLKLPLNKRFKSFDNFRWEEFGLKEYPLMDKFAKDGFDGYPFIMVDNKVVEPAQKILLKSYLMGYLAKEFIIR